MNDHDQIKRMMKEELTSFFNADEPEGKRFLDVTKIPRICEDIRTISRDVTLLKRIIYGAIGIILVAWLNNTMHFTDLIK